MRHWREHWCTCSGLQQISLNVPSHLHSQACPPSLHVWMCACLPVQCDKAMLWRCLNCCCICLFCTLTHVHMHRCLPARMRAFNCTHVTAHVLTPLPPNHQLCVCVCRCLRHTEPVLLVGETGTGKTTVCQLLALMRGQRLHVLNCNQHTETSDFLGGFRPARGRCGS